MICDICHERVVVSDADDNAMVLHALGHILKEMQELKELFKVVAL
jgi:hypothetical protein